MAGVYLRDLQNRVSTVTKGFYHLYQEFKVVRPLYSISPELRTRAQHELIRIHTAALKKVGVIFVLQLVPIVGNLPILIAIAYPKMILTSHFWSPEQRLGFLKVDYEVRKASAQSILSNVAKMKNIHLDRSNCSQSSTSLTSADETLSNFGTPSFLLWSKMMQDDSLIDKFDRQHFSLLTINNNITEFSMLRIVAPTMLLKHWLNSRVSEIVEDDMKLVKEGVSGLTNIELQYASIRRGFNPLLDERLLRRSLDFWLGEQVRDHERQSILEEKKTSGSKLNSTALLHLIAHNAATMV